MDSTEGNILHKLKCWALPVENNLLHQNDKLPM